MRAWNTIAARIALLVSLPTLAIGTLTQQSWSTAANSEARLAQIAGLADLATHISATVHELQKERGRSAGYLGSSGKKFASELPAQHGTTDLRVHKLEASIESIELESLPETFTAPFYRGTEALKRLATMRHGVVSLDTPLGEALSYYTAMNANFLDSIGAMSRLTQDSALNTQILAYMNFLKGKERAGIERAVMSATFARDAFPKGLFTKFVRLVTEQHTYFTEFSLLAQPEQTREFERALDSREFQDVQRMRDVAMDNAQTGGFSIDPSLWFDTITKKINGLKELENDLSRDLLATTASKLAVAHTASFTAGAVGIGALALLTLLGFWCARSILRPIRVLQQRFRDISEGGGDLTKRANLESPDEIGDLGRNFDTFVDNLAPMIREVASGANQLDRGARQIAETSHTVSAAAAQQASGIQQIHKSVAGIQSSTLSNVEHAHKSHAKTSEMSKLASQGREETRLMDEAMAGIQSSSTQIEQIIRVIDDIAFQTNLLALNAAVEAARAGEAGKGFAVVSDEVRSLAQRSKEAARSTSKMISDSTQRATHGIAVATRVSESLARIADHTQEVNQLVGSISTSCDEQAESLASITRNLTELDGATQSTATSSRQVFDSATNAVENVEELRRQLGRFRA